MNSIFTKNKSILDYDAETEVATGTENEVKSLKAYQFKGTVVGAIMRKDADKTFFKIEYGKRYNKDLFNVIRSTMTSYSKYFLPVNEVGVQKSRNTSIEISKDVKESRGLNNMPTEKNKDSFILKESENQSFDIIQNTRRGLISEKTFNFVTFIRYNDFIKSKVEYLKTHQNSFKKSNNDTTKNDTQENSTQKNNNQESNAKYSTISELHTTNKQISATNANTNNVCKDIQYECNCKPVNTEAINQNDVEVDVGVDDGGSVTGGKKYRVLRKSNKVKKSKVYNKYRFLNRSINKRKPFNKLTRKHKRKRRLPPPF